MPEALIQRVVHVTPEHIANGKQGDILSCPIALALAEVYGFAKVGGTAAYLIHMDWDSRYALSQFISQWIADFDIGRPVQPIDVVVNVERRLLWAC